MEPTDELRSTLAQLITFTESVVWIDLQNEILLWLNDIRNKLERETDPGLIQRLQGNAEACRHFLQLPQQLIAFLEGPQDGAGL